MKTQFHGFIVALPLALLAGCSSTGGPTPGTADVGEQSMVTEPGAVSSGASSVEPAGVSPLEDPNSPLAQRVLYFDYDSSEIRPEDQQLISAHAAYLSAEGGVRVTLAGNTDERGSPEYNVGLGERRAQSVRRAFELQGVTAEQLTVVSYGEEKPADEGHSEAAWQQNRRVEIVYQSN